MESKQTALSKLKVKIECMLNNLQESGTNERFIDGYKVALRGIKLYAEDFIDDEKEQITEARDNGIESAIKGYGISSEQYYNETYGE
jgi:hypothetical protein